MPDVYDPINAQMSVRSSIERLNDFVTDLLGRSVLQLWLYQNNVTPAATNTLAAVQEANFSGYSRFTVGSFTATAVDPLNNAYVTSSLADFACNGGGVNNTIYGSLLVGTNPSGVQATATNAGNSGAYASSFTITAGGSGYQVAPAVHLTGATGTGATAHAVITNGVVTSIVLDTPGSAYTTYTVTIDAPVELLKQNVLTQAGISMALATDALQTYCQLIEPSQAA
jgi:hypothetical protein